MISLIVIGIIISLLVINLLVYVGNTIITIALVNRN